MAERTDYIQNKDGSVTVNLETPDIVADLELFGSENFNMAHGILANDLTYPSVNDLDKRITGVELLEEMGKTVIADFEMDNASRKEWEENVASDIKLFNSFMEKKSTPWPDCSNVNVPLISIAVLQFQARAYEALITPKEVVKALPVEENDLPTSERVAKFMNYQLLYDMEDFETGMDKSLVQLPIQGSVFRKTYYDVITGKIKSQYISAMDFVVNYGAKSLKEASCKSHILYMRPSDIKKRIAAKLFLPWAFDLGFGSNRNSSPIKEASDSTQGVNDTLTYATTPRMIIEQHRGWVLDESGIEVPLVITVDYETQKVLRVTQSSYVDAFGEEQVVEYFTHYEFIPNPEGFYGLGFGSLLRGLNESANTLINEVIDAGTLANLQGGFVSKRSGINKGELTFRMGEYQELDGYIEDIKNHIYNFDFKGPNATLFQVLGLLMSYSEKVSTVTEGMYGEMPSSDTPNEATMSMLEEGRKVFSSIYKRIHRAFKSELEKVYRLNSLYLDDRKYFHVLGVDNLPTEILMTIGKVDFASKRDVVPVSDASIVSRAERAVKAKSVLDATLADPHTAQNPAIVAEAKRRYYTAIGIENIEPLLPQPPPPPQPMPPEVENSDIIGEKPAQVMDEDDHMHHYQVHNDLLTGSFANQLSPFAMNIVRQHIQAHMSKQYLIEAAQRTQLMNQGGMAGESSIGAGVS